MGISFTPKQQEVIEARDCNLLVSAAAGSGKTAVLTERIVQMISDKENPIHIDRLLVVTFTNAAAAEMRERIGAAIEAKLTGEPENEHLQKQAALVHNAQITTIDSFCMFVIRNNFNDIDLDPGFRIADEGERKLMQQEVMEALLEEQFGEGREEFLDCVEYFSTGSKDQAIEGHILKLYEFAMSNPWPQEWLSERKKDYLIEDVADFDKMPFVLFALGQVNQILRDCAKRVDDCLRICHEPDGPYMYGEVLDAEKEMLEGVLPIAFYEEGYGKLAGLSFARLPSKKDDSVHPGKREMIQKIRKEMKDAAAALQETFFPVEARKMAAYMQGSMGAVCTLVDLTLKFKEAFTLKKREANVLDFDDIEHLALAVLTQRQGDDCLPTRAAMDYRAYFSEIMIDEYQDSNLVQEYLLRSISGEEEGRNNRFMVGDVKQSIYKFRLARPEIFMEKYEEYQSEEGCRRIDLSSNFRSRKEVIDSVNYLFFQIMGEELGGVEYDAQAALYPGAAYPVMDPDRGDGSTEILLSVEAEESEEKISAKKREAYAVAARIKELVGHFPVTDMKTGKTQPAAFKDIVILLRSNAGWDEEFREVFKEEGIPAHAASKTGYFSAPEIQTLLQLLRVIDNPMQDIALFGTLKSVFCEFDDGEIARIKSFQEGTKGHLYDGLREYMRDQTDELAEKIRGFFTFLEEYRDLSVYLPIHDLLRSILAKSGYLQAMAALPGGEQRRANVEVLLEKASAFQKTSYYGLFHFIRYVEQLEKYDVDYGEANILDENADVVRLMSIHKSKGLEFPICFVCGLSKRFNMQDTSGRMIADVDMGIGVDYVDHRRRFLTGTLRKNVIARKMRQDNLGEELRVLYVALTRAKEKLILSGYMKTPVRRFEKLQRFRDGGKSKIPFLDLFGAADYFDFILPALANHPCFDEVMEELGIATETAGVRQADQGRADASFRFKIIREDELVRDQLKQQLRAEDLRTRLLASHPMTALDNEFMTYLSNKFEYKYEHANLAGLYTKTTVSELKKAGQSEELDFSFRLFQEPEVIPYLPKFMQTQENLGGAGRGSAFHKVLELVDFSGLHDLIAGGGEAPSDERKARVLEELRNQVQLWKSQGRLEEEYAQAVSLPLVAEFCTSKLAGRMGRADAKGLLHKEQPFVLGLSAAELNIEFPVEETVLIQGIIDVYFEEDGELVVADYKTDRVKNAGELSDKYAKQLDYYARALTTLTGMQVKEKILYSFGLGREIML